MTVLDPQASQPQPASGELQLTLVMPVYNEAEAIGSVLREWHEVLKGIGESFVIAVYDDGSTDATATVLKLLAGEIPELRVARHSNRGHGPTILRGYGEARSTWVFQTDSDGEIPAAAFPPLWRERGNCDFVFGRRTGRPQSRTRKLISRVAQGLIHTGFGAGVTDVNTPCRLMRSSALGELLPWLPETLFAPNVAISGLAVRGHFRILEMPVRFEPRRFGGGSLLSWRIWRLALRSAVETLGVLSRARPGRR